MPEKNPLESAHVFGRHQNLVGVACAADPSVGCMRVATVFVTPGMLHHTGPFGLHVEMARRLSGYGVPSLRFCLSGIGESLAVGAAGTSTERAADEIHQAMDWLQDRWGIERFILFGLCSGADDSVHAALADRRVVGLGLMDGCGYRTTGYYLRRWLLRGPRRVMTRSFWETRWHKWTRRDRNIASTLAAGDDIREFPDREQAQREFEQLAARGTEMFFLYTGGVLSYYNHAAQFQTMFPRLVRCPRIRVQFRGHLDHVVRLVEDRRMVVEEMSRWMYQVALTHRSAESDLERVLSDSVPSGSMHV